MERLVKPRANIDSSNKEPKERIDFYANSDMKPVRSLGLYDDEYSKCRKIANSFDTSASYASG